MRTGTLARVALVVLSGFYVVFSESWSLLYQWNLVFHPLLGIVVTFEVFRHTILEWRKRRAVGAQADVPAAVQVGEQALLVFWGLSLLSGLPLIPGLGLQFVFLCYLHRYISYVLVGLIFLHGASLARSRRQAGPEGGPVAGPRPNPVVFALIFLLAVAVPLSDRFGREDAYTYELTTDTKLPLQAEGSGERIMRPDLVRMVSVSETCGSAAFCHAPLVEDFLKSAHNVGFQMPFFQKNLDLLVEETGQHNVRNCAGCHAPLAVVAGDNDYTEYKDANNSSCVFCHIVEDVGFGPDPRKSSYTVRPNARHLAMFLSDSGEGMSRWHHHLIKMNPLGHGRVFSRKLYKEDRYCQACHHLQLKQPRETGFQRPTCADCHMQPRNLLGLPGTEMNHYFPGSNTAIPYIRQDEETLEMMLKWLRGDYPLHLKGWGAFWDLRPEGYTRADRDDWLKLRFEPQTPPVQGKPFTLRITTANVGIEHPFPSSVVELIEVWLAVQVQDAHGREIFRSGDLDEHGFLDPEAHTLGGYLLDDEGNVIDRNRIWMIKKKVITRQIEAGGHVTDDYEFLIPEDAGDSIEVRARWNYRKINQDFINWAYPDEKITMPVAEVASLTARIPLQTAAEGP